MGNVGNRVRLSIERPDRALVEKLLEASPTDLADAMNKSGAMRGIVPMYQPMARCVGPAVTVKVPAGSSMMVLKAMELAQPGDVLVIDGQGVISASLWGGNRSAFAARKQLAGVIVDGGVRDIEETRAVRLPLFARAVAPMAGASAGTGEVNYPVSCGGVVVAPGDLVVADAEGVAVVPREDLEDVYRAWRKIVDREQAWRADSASGRQVGGLDVNRLLEEARTEIVP
jgi:4-hydroxy-4-methyl-2-oxoglutarate aldolase